MPIIHHAGFESSEVELRSGLAVGVESGIIDSPAAAAVSDAIEGVGVGVAGSEGAADSEIVSAGVGTGEVVGVGLGIGPPPAEAVTAGPRTSDTINPTERVLRTKSALPNFPRELFMSSSTISGACVGGNARFIHHCFTRALWGLCLVVHSGSKPALQIRAHLSSSADV
jgi:hypothetical protein